MKKITIILTLFITFTAGTVSAQKADRRPYNKDVAKKFADFEQGIQIYLSEEFVLTNVQLDTVVSTKKGVAVTTINTHTITIKIRYKERGRIVEWRGDTCFVEFSTEDKELTTLPFTPIGGGGRSNNLALMVNTICGQQINGDPIICPATTRKITLPWGEEQKLVFTFQGDRPNLEYVGQSMQTNEVKKVKSKGVKVK